MARLPSDGTLSSFLTSGGGILLIVYVILSILFSVAMSLVGIAFSIYAASLAEKHSTDTVLENNIDEDSRDGEGGTASTGASPPAPARLVPADISFHGSGGGTTQEFVLSRGEARFTVTAAPGAGTGAFFLEDDFGQQWELYRGPGTSGPRQLTIEVPRDGPYHVVVDFDGDWEVTVVQSPAT